MTKTKTKRDSLFVVLSNPDSRKILKLMKADKICTYSQMIAEFSKGYDDGKRRNGLFAHNIKNLLILQLIVKDKETGFYWITTAGKEALKGALILERALDEKLLNDPGKKGKLVMQVSRS